jgi:putative thiamine transport system substrate-binding protein
MASTIPAAPKASAANHGGRQRAMLVVMTLVAACLLLCAVARAAGIESPAETHADWSAIERQARGTTVYFNAWGGDEAINRYIAWTRDEVSRRYGVTLVHVKVNDIAEAVTRILAERAAGRLSRGTVDLLWLNGENFAALKQAGLLYGPWTDRVPNARFIDVRGNPTTVVDFTLPTDRYELAWGSARLTLFYDSSAIPDPPRDPAALLAWIRAHPGRFTYPRPPNFLGTSFLKQLLLVLTPDPGRLSRPVGGDFERVTRPVWAWLDAAHPGMWRRGRLFPPSGPAQCELLAVGEVDWCLAFNPLEAARAISHHELPGTVRATTFSAGALANSHFLAIPFNATSPAGALLVANFLVSAQAQARKADIAIWGDPTVLDLRALSAEDRSRFAPGERSSSVGPLQERVIVEPHPSWSAALDRAWDTRYSVQ